MLNSAPDISIRDNTDTQIGVLYGYFNDTIELFLEGKVSVLTLSVLDENNYRELLEKGNHLSFTYEDEDYHMQIVKRDEDEDVITITAWALVLELNNETKGSYEGTSLTFAQYLNAFDAEKILTLNINEVASKKISYKWDTQTSLLERLFSLASVFEAEIEFKAILDEDGSLKQLQINVYKAHDTSNQGLGEDKTSKVFYFGDTITTVKKVSDITNLYTAVRAKGKDGLTLGTYKMDDIKDANGETLYSLANGTLYAPQAREQFPSSLINKKDRWIAYDWTTDYTTQASLCSNALAKLKELSQPAMTWTITGWIDGSIGDSISINDDGYTPTLLLEARIIGQKLCMTDRTNNETTFSNVSQVQNEISAQLLAKMNELISENTVYTANLITTNGDKFKNGIGSTTLKAQVYAGIAEVTQDVTVRWYKNNEFVKTAYEIEVSALDIDERAVYKFEVIDTYGALKAQAEVTLTNVNDGSIGADGKSTYLHIAYANSADGSVGFSINDASGKGFVGQYSNFNPDSSLDYTKYNWIELASVEVGGRNLLYKSGVDVSLVGTGEVSQLPDEGILGLTKASLLSYGFKTGDKVTFQVEYEVAGDDLHGTLNFRLGSTSIVSLNPTGLPIAIAELGTFKFTQTLVLTDEMLLLSYQDILLSEVPESVTITIRNRKLERGNKATDWTPAIEDINDQIEDKIGNDEYTNDKTDLWEELGNRVTNEEAQEIRDMSQSLVNSYGDFINEGGQYQTDMQNLEARTSALVNQLGDQLATYEFLQTYINLGEEGLLIGSDDSSMKVLLSQDKLSFMDGGQVVAYFSNQAFYINRGAIVDSLQVGQHKMVKLDNEHTIFQYVK